MRVLNRRLYSPIDEFLVWVTTGWCWASLEEAHVWGLVLGVYLTLVSSCGLDFLSPMV